MPYFVIEKFNGGVDLRRLSSASSGGTMRKIQNAFVNKGGEIEKRRRWTEITAVSDVLSASSNRLKCVGPIETFDRDGALFLVETEGSTGFTVEGGGTVTSVGSYTFATYDLGSHAFTSFGNSVTASELYPDEIMVSFRDVPFSSGGQVTQVKLNIAAGSGDITPTSDSSVTGRSGQLGQTANRAVIDFVGRFLSLIGVSPTTER